MIEKNDEFQGYVEGLGSDGEGIIKIQGTTVFVPFCLVGEEVKFKVLKVKGNIAYGKLLKVITPSKMRIEPKCKVFGKCGGCDLQHLSYEGQLEFKRQSVKNALLKIGGINFDVDKCVAGDLIFEYRNKLALPVDGVNKQVGFYARGSHRIVETDNCAIQAAWNEKVIKSIKEFAKEKEGEFLRHMVVREIEGKFIFTIVSSKRINAQKLIKLLKNDFEKFTLLLNINNTQSNVIFGEEWQILYGSGFFCGEEGGVKFKAGANTFVQVNDDVRSKLYKKVFEEVPENCTAVDLYSGGGLLTAMLAKKCNKAYGIEIVEQASLCADELRTENNLQDKMFNICGGVEENIQNVFEKTKSEEKVIVCDPPRKGMDRSVVKALIKASAKKIILISCNPATLARDLGIILGTLVEKWGELVKVSTMTAGERTEDLPCTNYKIDSITPFDMFPQTKWCETLVVLSQKN